MTSRHKGWRWIALLAVAVLAIGATFSAACGDDDDDDGDNTPAAQATQPAAEATEPADEPTEPAAEATEPAGGEDGPTIAAAESAELGAILVDSRGFTLYTFTNDTPGSGESACVDGCATAWPPLTVTGEATADDGVTGELDTIERADGTTQVTYNGAPLYFFASDTAPGDTNGHEVGGIWFVAMP